ncbi:MAG TPA: nucleotidyltransferase domain-containing protein [Thermoanaerobaculia bacterium]
MSLQETLDRLCRDHGVLAVYLFGSRAKDGLRVLKGEEVSREGSDLDVGVVFRDPSISFERLASLQVGFEDVFAPLRVDLVPLNRVDALFQFAAIDGHRIVETDVNAADDYELRIMNRAADLLPIQRRIELERFGVSTT